MGQGNNASWPVGGATRQSGGNWVGRFEKPEDWNIWASMYSLNLELGQLITVGDSILKWTAAGVKFVDAVFATQADFDSFCSKIGTPIATGSAAMVAGVSSIYRDGAWVANGLTPYADYATLSAQTPTVGKIAQIPRLCGNGYFALRGNGTRWEVCPGESIIRDSGVNGAGYSLTATGTAYVPLASYAIPAGLIGDGEQCGSVHFAENTGVLAGTDAYQVRIANNQIACVSNYTFTNRRTTATGNIVRTGSSIICLSAGSLSGLDVNNYPGGLQATDLAASQTISIGVTPGAAGNTLKINQWSFRRIA